MYYLIIQEKTPVLAGYMDTLKIEICPERESLKDYIYAVKSNSKQNIKMIIKGKELLLNEKTIVSVDGENILEI